MISSTSRLTRGLYAIADTSILAGNDLFVAVEHVIRAGACAVQYRDKQSSDENRYRDAMTLSDLCRANDIPFIVNDDIQLAKRVFADGVHLGKDDAPLDEARQILGDTAVIGASCYNRLDSAVSAQGNGANYVAFGRFFTSATKPEAVQADTQLLTTASQSLSVPIVAIGGITPQNGSELVIAGADLLAVIAGIFGQANIETAARQYVDIFKNKISPVNAGQSSTN